jgi:hypothetical protein
LVRNRSRRRQAAELPEPCGSIRRLTPAATNLPAGLRRRVRIGLVAAAVRRRTGRTGRIIPPTYAGGYQFARRLTPAGTDWAGSRHRQAAELPEPCGSIRRLTSAATNLPAGSHRRLRIGPVAAAVRRRTGRTGRIIPPTYVGGYQFARRLTPAATDWAGSRRRQAADRAHRADYSADSRRRLAICPPAYAGGYRCGGWKWVIRRVRQPAPRRRASLQ